MPERERSFDPRRPFTRRAGLAAGLTPSQLRGPSFRRVFHGVYVRADVPASPRERVRAALLTFPATAWASHASAARVYDLPIPTLPEEYVTVPRRSDRRDRAGVRCLLRPPGRLRSVDGMRVSDFPQLFVELAELLSLVDLVVVGDALVRQGRVSLADLVGFCATSRLPGAELARRAASYVRERVDSPMETRLRMLIVLAGLPEPQVNLTVYDESGVPVRRYDLSYPEVKVIVEYDGRHHVERSEQWEADLERREAIDDDQWRILVVTSKGVFGSPEATLARLHRLLLARGLDGVPARLSDDWRPHFPGRARVA